MNDADRMRHFNQCRNWISNTCDEVDREAIRVLGEYKYQSIRTTMRHSELGDEEMSEAFDTSPSIIGLIRWRDGYGRS